MKTNKKIKYKGYKRLFIAIFIVANRLLATGLKSSFQNKERHNLQLLTINVFTKIWFPSNYKIKLKE